MARLNALVAKEILPPRHSGYRLKQIQERRAIESRQQTILPEPQS